MFLFRLESAMPSPRNGAMAYCTQFLLIVAASCDEFSVLSQQTGLANVYCFEYQDTAREFCCLTQHGRFLGLIRQPCDQGNQSTLE